MSWAEDLCSLVLGAEWLGDCACLGELDLKLAAGAGAHSEAESEPSCTFKGGWS